MAIDIAKLVQEEKRKKNALQDTLDDVSTKAASNIFDFPYAVVESYGKPVKDNAANAFPKTSFNGFELPKSGPLPSAADTFKYTHDQKRADPNGFVKLPIIKDKETTPTLYPFFTKTEEEKLAFRVAHGKNKERENRDYKPPENIGFLNSVYQKKIEDAKESLDREYGNLISAAAAYKSNSSKETEEAYNIAYGRYARAIEIYNKANSEYSEYAEQENQKLADWKKTIRNREVVEAEVDAYNRAISNLIEKRENVGKSLGGLGVEKSAALKKQIDKLTAERDLISRELYYAKEIENAEIRSRKDFAELKKPSVVNQDEYGADIHKKVNERAADYYVHVTADEQDMFNYYWNKYGRDRALKYHEELEDTLRQREGYEQYREYDEKSGVSRALHGAKMAAVAGLQDFGGGVAQIFTEDAIDTTVAQYAAANVSENASLLGGFAFDFTRSLANMAPSVLLSMATQGVLSGAGIAAGAAKAIGGAVGSATLGTSAGGNAYSQKIKEGYSPEQARSYGLLVGASEALLEAALGGISKLKVIPSGDVVAKNIDAIDKAFLRVPAKYILAGAKEGNEEALQTILEPVFAEWALNEKYKPAELTEIVRSYLLGAVTGGLFEYAGGDVRESERLRKQKQGNEQSVGEIKNTAQADGRKIYPNMPDDERAAVLAEKKITVPSYNSTEDVSAEETAQLKGKYMSAAKDLLKRIAEKCGVFRSDYYNADVDLKFEYSKGSYNKSYNAQTVGSNSADDFGKMIALLPQIIDGAVEIEAHTDKYADTIRADEDLKEQHVLLGAFRDGDRVVPVKLEIKEFKDRAKKNNKLYMTVTLQQKEAGVTVTSSQSTNGSHDIGTIPASEISISELLVDVKDDSGGIFKYLPDSMLTEERITSKKAEKVKDSEYISSLPRKNTSAYTVAQDEATTLPNDPTDRVVQRAAATLGLNGARAFRDGYTASVAWDVPFKDAQAGFKAVYSAALDGREMTQGEAQAAAKIPQEMRTAAENAARADMARAKGATYYGEQAGLDRGDENHKRAKLSSRDIKVLDAIGKALGVKIRFAENLKDSDGKPANAQYGDGVLTISLASENPVRVAFTHEVVHRLREVSPEAYRTLAEFVQTNMSEETLSAYENATARDYGNDLDTVSEEVIANAFGELMGNRDMLDRFCREHLGAARTLRDIISDLITKIKSVFSKNDDITFSELRNELQEMERTLTSALTRAAADVQKLSNGKQKNTDIKTGVVKNQIRRIPGTDMRYVYMDRQIKFGDNMKENEKWIMGYIDDVIRGGKDIIIPTTDGHDIQVTERSSYEVSNAHVSTKKGTTTKLVPVDLLEIKYIAAAHLDEIIKIAKKTDYSPDVTGKHKNDVGEDGFNYFTSWFAMPRRTESGKIETDYYKVQFSAGLNGADETMYGLNVPQKRRTLSQGYGSSENRRSKNKRQSSSDEIISQEGKGRQEEIYYSSVEDTSPNNAFAAAMTKAEKKKEANPTDPKSSKKGVTDAYREVEILKREKQRLDKEVEFLRSQTKRTKKPIVRPDDVARMVRRWCKNWSADLEERDVFDDVKALADYMVQNPEVSVNDFIARARKIAARIVESALVIDDDMYRTYEGFRNYVRGADLVISREDARNIPDFESFRRQNIGRMPHIKYGEHSAIDKIWGELCELWPEFFDPETTHQAEMLMQIAEAWERIQPVTGNPYSYNAERATEHIAVEMVEDLLNGQVRRTSPTYADRQAAKIKKEKDELRQRMRKHLADESKRNREREAEIEKKAREREQNIRVRAGVNDLVRSLNKRMDRLSAKLLRPTDARHIPEDLRGVVAMFLYNVNRESVYDVIIDPETGSEKRVKIGSAEWLESELRKPTQKTTLAREKQNEAAKIAKQDRLFKKIMEQTGYSEGDGMAHAALELAEYLEELKADPKKRGGLVYSDDLIVNLKKIAKLPKEPLGGMSREGLLQVLEVTDMIESAVANAERALAIGNAKKIKTIAHGIRNYNRRKEDPKNNATAGLKNVFLEFLNLETFLHRLGPTGEEINRALKAAQSRHEWIKSEIEKFTNEVVKNIDVRKLEKTKHKVVLDGKKRTMSTAQLMELYLLMERPAGRRHILTGGLRIDKIEGITGTPAQHNEEIRPTRHEIDKALSKLSREEKAVAEKLQKFAAEKLGGYGNEASLEVFGYRKFNDPHYWPIRAKHWSALEEEARSTKIANLSQAKQLENDSTPLYIGSVFETCSRHAEAQALYASYLKVEQDMERLMNYTFWEDTGEVDERGNPKYKTDGDFQSVINRIHGEGGMDFLRKQMQDIQGKAAGDESLKWGDKLISAGKVAAVGANLRVIAQQPTAIFRAMAEISPKYLAMGCRPNSGWEKSKEWTAVSQMKDRGYQSAKEMYFNTASRRKKVGEIALKAAGKADACTWGIIWNACESEVKAKRKELEVGSDEFYSVVADRFTEIIDLTQVVDGTLQRTQIMRSKNWLAKTATMFMSEPMKTYNMLVRSIYDVVHAEKGERGKAIVKLARTSAALLMNAIANAAAQSLVDAIRIDDDEDREKKYWQRWWEAFTGITGDEESMSEWIRNIACGNLVGQLNPLSWIPFVKDTVSLASGYEVSRADIDVIGDLLKAGGSLVKALQGDGKKTVPDAIMDMVGEVARMFGIPVSNVIREAKGLAMTAAIEWDKYLWQYHIDKVFNGSTTQKYNVLYAAEKNGSTDKNAIYQDMLRSGIGEEKIRTAMQKRQKEDAGVESVEDLDRRWIAPEQERKYKLRLAANTAEMKESAEWAAANSGERAEMEARAKNDAYEYASRTGGWSDQGEKLDKAIEAGEYTPETKKDFDRLRGSVRSSEIWKAAEEDDQQYAERIIYELVTGTGNGKKYKKTLADGEEVVALTREEWIRYRLALRVADKSKGGDKNGTYNAAEKEIASRKAGLTGDKAEYLNNPKKYLEDY